MITDPFQRKAYDAVAAALPFAIDPAKITVEPGVSYLPSPIKLHDYAVGGVASGAGVVYLAAAPQARAARVIWRCIRLSDSVSHAYLTESLLSATTEPNAAMTPTT